MGLRERFTPTSFQKQVPDVSSNRLQMVGGPGLEVFSLSPSQGAQGTRAVHSPGKGSFRMAQ